MQGQLGILNLEWCDFVVWTNVDLHVERVKADPEFWQLQCLPKLEYYYYNIMLPEIVYPRHPLDTGSIIMTKSCETVVMISMLN